MLEGPVCLSSLAHRAQPGLARGLEALGLRVLIGPARRACAGGRSIAAAAEGAGSPTLAVARADGAAPSLAAPAGVPVLSFDPADQGFGHALAARLLVAPGTPAAADSGHHALLALAARVGASPAGVLIEGPTGTGKEVLARVVHMASPRAGQPLLAVNCAALPEAMLEAILFGHERGAFTGAATATKGLFRAADGGTLLLDEVAELPLALQAKLLRVLQERELLPIGATQPVRIDVRVIATANRCLKADVAAGRFRADLYYRLSVFPLVTTPLANRPADLPALTAALLLRHGAAGARWWPTPAALDRLAAHEWPGNVRELDNVLQRALVLAGDARIDVGHLLFDTEPAGAPPAPAFDREPAPATVHAQQTPGGAPAVARGVILAQSPKLAEIVRGREHAAIRAALAECGGRRLVAATRLGISERTLRYKLAEMTRLGATPARVAHGAAA